MLFFIISENLERGRFREFGISRLDPCDLLVCRHLSVNFVNVCLNSVLSVGSFSCIEE